VWQYSKQGYNIHEHKEIMFLTAFHHMIQTHTHTHTHTHTITLWFRWVELHVIEELLDLLRWYIAGCSNPAIPHRVHFSETCKYVNTQWGHWSVQTLSMKLLLQKIHANIKLQLTDSLPNFAGTTDHPGKQWCIKCRLLWAYEVTMKGSN